MLARPSGGKDAASTRALLPVSSKNDGTAADDRSGNAHAHESSPQPTQVGDWLRIELYFDLLLREPIILFGRVTGCAELAGDGAFRIAAELGEMSKGIGESIARLAFLTQRQQRAQHSVRTAARRET